MSLYLKRLRRLTFWLIVSGSCNIILSTLFVYWVFKERPPTLYCEHKPTEFKDDFELSNNEVIRNLQTLSFQELCSKLSSQKLIENGYSERDLALGCLVAHHQFDLSRALVGLSQPTKPRLIDNVPVFPGLSDVQFGSIQNFIQTERWPFTAQGLFLRLKNGEVDSSLVEAFCFTPHYMTIEMLFRRSDYKVDKDTILQVICSGDWDMLSSFTKKQRESQDLSAHCRQQFLLDYIKEGSKQAAALILKTDLEAVTKKLDDSSVLNILKCLDEKTDESEIFAISLLTSPRSDAVWELAAKRLYEYSDEEPPRKFQHHAALSKFVAGETIQHEEDPEREVCLYIVEEGDSLWKIANKHHVTIEDIVEANHLESNVLRPGNLLEIPL